MLFKLTGQISSLHRVLASSHGLQNFPVYIMTRRITRMLPCPTNSSCPIVNQNNGSNIMYISKEAYEQQQNSITYIRVCINFHIHCSISTLVERTYVTNKNLILLQSCCYKPLPNGKKKFEIRQFRQNDGLRVAVT